MVQEILRTKTNRDKFVQKPQFNQALLITEIFCQNLISDFRDFSTKTNDNHYPEFS